jgi:hypothetical protein
MLAFQRTWKYGFIPHNVLSITLSNGSGIFFPQTRSNSLKAIIAELTAI